MVTFWGLMRLLLPKHEFSRKNSLLVLCEPLLLEVEKKLWRAEDREGGSEDREGGS